MRKSATTTRGSPCRAPVVGNGSPGCMDKIPETKSPFRRIPLTMVLDAPAYTRFLAAGVSPIVRSHRAFGDAQSNTFERLGRLEKQQEEGSHNGPGHFSPAPAGEKCPGPLFSLSPFP